MRTNTSRHNFAILTIVIFTLMISKSLLFGQQNGQDFKEIKVPSVFLGLGLGINDCGLAGTIEIPIIEEFSIFGNAGIGGWGWKTGGGFIFYPKLTQYKSGLSIGYSLASGVTDFETVLWTEPDEEEELVELDLNNVGTINLIYSYNLKIGKSCKFIFSTGYSISVTKEEPYEIITPGVIITENSERFLKFMQPGELIFGFKFMFGI